MRSFSYLLLLVLAARPAAAQQSRITFVRAGEQEGVGGRLWSLNPDGSPAARQLSPRNFIHSVTVSPDGRRLALTIEVNLSYLTLYTMDADGRNTQLLLDTVADSWGATWSPDGARLVFASKMHDHEHPELYTINADGSGLARLTISGLDENLPTMAVDGRVAFERGGEVWLLQVGGEAARRLGVGGNPRFSPDGTRIAFTSERDGNAEIYVMNVDGSNVTRLTRHDSLDAGATWSPDGRRIAFTSRRDGNGELYVMNADGSALRRLTNTPRDEWSPTWGVVPTTTVARAEPPPAPGRVLLPAGYDTTRTWPVVIFFPPTFSTAAETAERYSAQLAGAVVIAVAGTGSPDDYMTGDDWWRTILRYERQAVADLARFQAPYRLDTTRVLLAGFSMGGDLAWALALRNPARFAGAMVMGSRASYPARPADRQALAARQLRFVFTLGSDEDSLRLAGARAATRMLTQAGVQHRYVEVPNIGHGAAPPAVFAEALQFLLNR